MKLLKVLIPFGISLVVVPIAIAVGFGTAIEGDFFYTKIVFPYSVLLTALVRLISGTLSDSVFGIAFVLMVIQFPIYGMIISLVERRDLAIVILAAIHVSLSVLSFIVSYMLGH